MGVIIKKQNNNKNLNIKQFLNKKMLIKTSFSGGGGGTTSTTTTATTTTAGGFLPSTVQGLQLWLRADVGLTQDTLIVSFVNEIIISDAGESSSNGTYSRASGGITSFDGDQGYIYFEDGIWFLYDYEYGDVTYYNDTANIDEGSWYEYSAGGAPTATYGTDSTEKTGITEWVDQSDNGFVFVADNGVSEDITFASSVVSLNNQPAVYFQTTNDNGNVGLYYDYYSPENTPFIGKSVFIVYILENINGFYYSVCYEHNGINLYTSYASNRHFGGYFNGFYDSNTSSTLNTAYIRSCLTDDGSPVNFFVNGSADGTPAGGSLYNYRSAIVIGNGNARGAVGGGTNQPFQGYIAEVIVYDNELSSNDRIAVENYLNSKYDIF